MDIVLSTNDVPIRMTDERWVHITENHDDLAGHYDDILSTVEEPDYVIAGYQSALIALQEFKKGKFLAVVYKEVSKQDGFIITAYFTNKLKLEKEKILWKRNWSRNA